MSLSDTVRNALGNKNYKYRSINGKDPLEEYSWLVFSDDKPEKIREKSIKKSKTAVALLLALGAALSVVTAIGNSNVASPKSFTRGDTEETKSLILELEYDGIKLEKELEISVLPQHIDEQSAQILFDECEEWIRSILEEKLSFPEIAPNGVSITWQNSDFSYVEHSPGTPVLLLAQLGAGEYYRMSSFTAVPMPTESDYLESLDSAAFEIADSLSRGDEGEILTLPLSEGKINLDWKEPSGTSPALIAAAAAFAAVFVWMSRFDSEKTLMKKRKQSFESSISDISFQIILYLNAGLIAESAFSQLIIRTDSESDPMYKALRDVKARSVNKNVTFISELYSYAKSTGSPGFLRFAALVYEHAGSGAGLAEKLERERDLSRGSRLTAARSKIKEAETKLCFPLILLLVALVIITAVPSFLTM